MEVHKESREGKTRKKNRRDWDEEFMCAEGFLEEEKGKREGGGIMREMLSARNGESLSCIYPIFGPKKT